MYLSLRALPVLLIRSTKLIPTHSGLAYGLAVAMVSTAVLVRLSLHPLLGDTLCDVMLYPVVLVAAVLGGGRVGLFALLLGAVSILLFRRDGAHGLADPRAFMDLGLYLLAGGLSVVVAASLRAAVERLEVAQERLVAALEASGTGTWRWNLRSKHVEWDPALIHLFGLEPDNAPRTEAEFARFIHPDDHAHVRNTISEAVIRGVADYEFRAVLPNGAVRWMYARSRMIRDGKGPAALMIGACLDITERKLAQERQTLLVHELNHRVKNTLSVVQSLALQTLRGSSTLEAFRDAFQARLFALSATHNILTQGLWESACMREILNAELKPFGGIDERRVCATGEPIRLTPRQALGFGMAFHELATNAVKYGSLSATQGSVAIAWRTAPDPDGRPLLLVDWIERDGPAVTEPSRRGFGSKLIERSICAELDGALQMRFDPSGLNCSFSVPL